MKTYAQRLLASGRYLALALMIVIVPAQALTLKTGEVLGSDGKVYEGASPAERARS